MAQMLDEVFLQARRLFLPYAHECLVLHDAPGRYYLGTHEVRPRDGYRTGFGGAEIRKAYVSVHLIPVYVHPALLDQVSSGLRARMQGKSCFNFKRCSEELFGELGELIAAGAETFRKDGRI